MSDNCRICGKSLNISQYSEKNMYIMNIQNILEQLQKEHHQRGQKVHKVTVKVVDLIEAHILKRFCAVK